MSYRYIFVQVGHHFIKDLAGYCPVTKLLMVHFSLHDTVTVDHFLYLVLVYESIKCNLKADVTFAIGFSSDTGFRPSKDFMKQLAGRLTMSPASSLMSVIQFGTDTDLRIKFNSVKNLQDFSSAVDRLTFSGKADSFDKALQTAYGKAISAKDGMRDEAGQVLVLVTDVNYDDSTAIRKSLVPFKEAGIKVLIISTNSRVIPKDLMDNTVNLFSITSFEELTTPKLLDQITNSICHGAGMDSLFNTYSPLLPLPPLFEKKQLFDILISRLIGHDK